MIFKDREDAAHRLVKTLEKYKGKNPLVLGIPRGAMPMARIIADGLNGELSAILVHKIPAPINQEFAIGSIGLSGAVQKTEAVKLLSISDSYIRSEAKRQLRTLKERFKKYDLKTPDYKNRIVIIVDDGIATGATVLAAIHEVRQHKPKKLIVAAAVAAKSSADQMRGLADELILLSEPENFFAVSEFFDDFPQVTDEEAVMFLRPRAFEKQSDVSDISP